ncbi:flagellar basal-body rod protein FlgC [Rhodoblastus acidophilus]|uniref:flagellar basal body rod protein FlgC n=1 Tax=Rhodoblastus acidophilus TaxID=1074 RepID=UPI002224D808|nr:flagellar basal body rod protein FlgC [Rhodoblastus acidophilus]MCW2284621.1 flagellar basal-body rod protein FlgC [Rhodoblastus acidophilus]MCW2333574.1 flagellar basal-body rod protein FlgC [Rhodoblastus acidophilus]
MAIDPLVSSMHIASSGLHSQSTRLRIVAENIANAHSTGSTAGADPYSRKTITFESELDRASGENLVQVKSIGADTTPFRTEHLPGHPAADASGHVKMPNVDLLFEMADMREANRSYEANLQIVKQSRQMLSATIDLLRT